MRLQMIQQCNTAQHRKIFNIEQLTKIYKKEKYKQVFFYKNYKTANDTVVKNWSATEQLLWTAGENVL